jgi:RNA polymerase sigma factor (sigma-70 family)
LAFYIRQSREEKVAGNSKILDLKINPGTATFLTPNCPLQMMRSNTEPETEEAKLVSSVLKGDIHAYPEFVRRYERLVASIVCKMISRQEDREDLCQEVFLKVYEKLGSFRFQSKLSTWIGNIAFHACINFLKKRRPVLLEDLYLPGTKDEDDKSIAELKDHSMPADEELYRKEKKVALLTAMDRLTVIQKTVVELFHNEELPLEEIAAITGLTINTVKSHLFRARKNLKNYLSNYLNH